MFFISTFLFFFFFVANSQYSPTPDNHVYCLDYVLRRLTHTKKETLIELVRLVVAKTIEKNHEFLCYLHARFCRLLGPGAETLVEQAKLDPNMRYTDMTVVSGLKKLSIPLQILIYFFLFFPRISMFNSPTCSPAGRLGQVRLRLALMLRIDDKQLCKF